MLVIDPPPPDIYTLSLHDALPISAFTVAPHLIRRPIVPIEFQSDHFGRVVPRDRAQSDGRAIRTRSEEHTSELQSRRELVCRLLLEKKKKRGREARGR